MAATKAKVKVLVMSKARPKAKAKAKAVIRIQALPVFSQHESRKVRKAHDEFHQKQKASRILLQARNMHIWSAPRCPRALRGNEPKSHISAGLLARLLQDHAFPKGVD